MLHYSRTKFHKRGRCKMMVEDKSMRQIVPSNHISVVGDSYDLYYVSFHHGRSLHIGHYTCICKRSNSWFYFNDDIVEEINIDINEWIKEKDLKRSIFTAAYQLKQSSPTTTCVNQTLRDKDFFRIMSEEGTTASWDTIRKNKVLIEGSLGYGTIIMNLLGEKESNAILHLTRNPAKSHHSCRKYKKTKVSIHHGSNFPTIIDDETQTIIIDSHLAIVEKLD